ncbi:uncharacterized protein LOC126335760 [Schistocerca gregaria]|uniref:uncharacterized protein LOC126335760 n=1 Tax=Schistocerca gregaria TaxID=7010 RepID=UPI00211E31F4|nr:uncharacterized protein LOC126335760 [Schistocerca gregaria]
MVEDFSGTADPLANLRRERGERRRYLGAMLDDADFLEGVLRRAHKCPLRASDQKVVQLAKEGLQLAREAHKTLEARRVVPDPTYVGQIFTEEMVERQKHRRVTDVGRAAKILERLAEANEAADMRMVLRHSERLWEFLVGRPAPLVGARERVRQLCEASRIVANARLRGLRPPAQATPAALEVRACRLMGAPLPRDYQPPPQAARRPKPLDLVDHK